MQQLQLPEVATSTDGRISENLCESAAPIADNLDARAIFCFTKRGVMANLLSRMRPNAPIFAFCNTQEVRQQLSMRWGITPFKLDFSNDPETNITRTIMLLRSRDLVSPGDLIVIVSDITSIQPVLGNSNEDGFQDDLSSSTVRSVQVRHIPL
jgi:pyruvate kinase